MFDDLIKYIYIIPSAIIAIVFHEFGHGIVSYMLGDDTPKVQGRLTLNPLKHLDAFGIICLIFLGFGWAKPVEVNPTNYKNKKLGMTLVALAGPLTNFLITLLSLVFVGIFLYFNINTGNMFFKICLNFFIYLGIINLGLCLFNLIPLPPLDGSKIIGVILPTKAYNEYMSYQKYGNLFLIALLILFYILDYFNVASPISTLVNDIYSFFYNLVVKIVFSVLYI